MLEDLKVPQRKTSCKIEEICRTLNEKDKTILLEAIFSLDWGVQTLANELNKRGIAISGTPIAKHREKNCACFRN